MSDEYIPEYLEGSVRIILSERRSLDYVQGLLKGEGVAYVSIRKSSYQNGYVLGVPEGKEECFCTGLSGIDEVESATRVDAKLDSRISALRRLKRQGYDLQGLLERVQAPDDVWNRTLDGLTRDIGKLRA